jgi:leukotriene-A4 hydrolase
MRRVNPAVVLVLSVLASCAAAAAGSPATPDARDLHSFARPEEARVVDLALDLAASFEQRTLSGTATLRIETEPGAREIVLDTRDLTIESVSDPSGQPLAFTLGEPEPVLGRPLRVALPENGRSIVIRYRTSPEAAALQWLAPEQTAGGRHPYPRGRPF